MEKTAIVISTYNGRRYVAQQLDSILQQSKRPDELVICDDASTDGTEMVLRQYFEEQGSAIHNVTIKRNKHNKGWKANFKQLLVSNTADLVFPCDQDDVWHEDKVEIMTQVMAEHPEYDVVASLYRPVYEAGSQRVRVYADEDGSRVRVRPQGLERGFIYLRYPGCTYCVRKSLIQDIKEYWRDSYPHDGFIWMCALLKGSLGIVDYELIDWRRHTDNASSRKKLTRNSRIAEIDLSIEFVDGLLEYAHNEHRVLLDRVESLQGCRKWLLSRRLFLTGEHVATSLRHMCLDRQYYISDRGLLVDIALGVVPGLSFKYK